MSAHEYHIFKEDKCKPCMAKEFWVGWGLCGLRFFKTVDCSLLDSGPEYWVLVWYGRTLDKPGRILWRSR